MSVLKESWESGLVQAIGGVVGIIVAWIFELPQKAWRWFKNWRTSRRDAKQALADGLGKIAGMAKDLASINYQIAPNGGGSLRDAVDRTEQGLATLVHDVATLKRDGALTTAILRFQADVADEITFHADPQGGNSFVSAGYQRLLGVSERDLRGYGWKNYIAQDEAVAYLVDQETCIRERRRFQRRVNMVRSDGQKVLVDVTITPYPDDAAQELKSLMGQIKPVVA